MPTTFGKNQLLHASRTTPRLVNTKPIRASVDANRTSIGNVMVAPIPTPGPLIAPMTGFLHSYSRSVNRPPPSRQLSGSSSGYRLETSKLFAPDERSAPAQNPRPAPVIMTARMSSSSSARSTASINSYSIWRLNAFSRSGRFRVIVRIFSSTS